ncbi:uncharacterized protein CLUP02_11375 [Colletotrichum lupini]|uniref:Uncharacterized protein n=1 Tax=Colletotrichum lupini TaxID=145971 RepID=A0A9Q8SYG5_9PEZI|nr:uncharacterized protein CLUP02_11375 [Colletotrichum lupini]UQC85876.1 hypothetical protein CLUP02_11375 [Colletotrichum lupini]
MFAMQEQDWIIRRANLQVPGGGVRIIHHEDRIRDACYDLRTRESRKAERLSASHPREAAVLRTSTGPKKKRQTPHNDSGVRGISSRLIISWAEVALKCAQPDFLTKKFYPGSYRPPSFLSVATVPERRDLNNTGENSRAKTDQRSTASGGSSKTPIEKSWEPRVGNCQLSEITVLATLLGIVDSQ